MKLDVAPLSTRPVPAALLDDAQTVVGALAAVVDRFPDFECLTILDRQLGESRLSMQDLWSRARRIQTTLTGQGLRVGNIALIALPTSPELVAAYFGVMLAGGVPGLIATPSNRVADLTVYAERVGAILRDARAQVLYCGDDLAPLFRAPEARLGDARVVTPADGATSDILAPIVPVGEADLATIQYSSGSTGSPKGILLTHRAMLNNIRAVRDGLRLSVDDINVNWIPLYHDMGLIDAFLLPLLIGCPSALIPTMDFLRDPARWLWAIHHYRGTLSFAPNFAFTLCAKRVRDEELVGLDLSSWRLALSGAEPVLAHTVSAFSERFRPFGFKPEAITPIWGMAENVTIATAHPLDQAPRVETIDRGLLARENIAQPTTEAGVEVVSVGWCLPGCEVEVRDPAHRPLPDRHVGTIWLRTNCLFSSYHRAPEATREALVDGWLDSGDRGYIADGHLFFVTRVKDLIVVGGEKYAPHDVETIINRVPGVREGCAIAFGVMNHERGTEDLAAVVETKETDEAALAGLCDSIRETVLRATGLGLRHLILVPPGGIEKTTSGKLARLATRSRYEERFVD